MESAFLHTLKGANPACFFDINIVYSRSRIIELAERNYSTSVYEKRRVVKKSVECQLVLQCSTQHSGTGSEVAYIPAFSKFHFGVEVIEHASSRIITSDDTVIQQHKEMQCGFAVAALWHDNKVFCMY